MNLLFKRSQTPGKFSRVHFQLWGMLELDESEKEIVKRYDFSSAILIEAIQPKLIRNTFFAAIAGFVAGAIVGLYLFGSDGGILLSLLAAGGAGYWYFHNKRETIYVRDLLHGRWFHCRSVIELARKEAFLETICGYLRQVMESAKHWDGTSRYPIEPLPKDEARQFIIKGV